MTRAALAALLLCAGCSTVGQQTSIPPPTTTTTWNPDPPTHTMGDPIRFTIGGFILTWEQP